MKYEVYLNDVDGTHGMYSDKLGKFNTVKEAVRFARKAAQDIKPYENITLGRFDDNGDYDDDYFYVIDSTETLYTVKPEFIDLWGGNVYEGTLFIVGEIDTLAREWEKPVEELLDQVEEI